MFHHQHAAQNRIDLSGDFVQIDLCASLFVPVFLNSLNHVNGRHVYRLWT
jgi:hypothetical protein